MTKQKTALGGAASSAQLRPTAPSPTIRRFDGAIVIGRMSPLTHAHCKLITTACEHADRVGILLGSANRARSIKTPFTWEERAEMLEAAFPGETEIAGRGTGIKPIQIAPVGDALYNDTRWLKWAQEAAISTLGPEAQKVAIVGHKKDRTSAYLDHFPSWDLLEIDRIPDLDATEIRNRMFGAGDGNNGLQWLASEGATRMPVAVVDWLLRWMRTSRAAGLIAKEMAAITDYRQKWAETKTPYPVIFQTVDAIVQCRGHILLVRRKLMPGEGLWAMPGGFIKPEEFLVDAAIRELREETKLKVPIPVLRKSLVSQRRFDHPDRSSRGRTITEVFHFEIEPDADGSLPKAKGSSDAAEAAWIPLGSLEPTSLHEDHYQIIDAMLGVS